MSDTRTYWEERRPGERPSRSLKSDKGERCSSCGAYLRHANRIPDSEPDTLCAPCRAKKQRVTSAPKRHLAKFERLHETDAFTEEKREQMIHTGVPVKVCRCDSPLPDDDKCFRCAKWLPGTVAV